MPKCECIGCMNQVMLKDLACGDLSACAFDIPNIMDIIKILKIKHIPEGKSSRYAVLFPLNSGVFTIDIIEDIPQADGDIFEKETKYVDIPGHLLPILIQYLNNHNIRLEA